MVTKYYDMGQPQVPFGAPMRHAHFAFAPNYTPLNHGSYGTHPVSVRAERLALLAEAEAAPDPFIALNFTDRLAKSRAVAADLLRCPVDDLVFVPNATTGIDTVLKNIAWQPGDVVLNYEVVYESVGHGVAYLVEKYGIEVHTVRIQWPVQDDVLVQACVDAAKRINAEDGKRVRLAIVDTIVSMPGARVPFERLVPSLQAEGALVLVDGAHGIGHIDINLSKLQPDFFVTNLHKWFLVPRGCAAFVVPKKHQDLIITSLPTGHLFRSRDKLNSEDFVPMFDFIGTIDQTNYLCVEAALKFRTEVCGGEEAIRAYSNSVAQKGAALAAEVLGTDIMDCPGSCLRDCNFANVRLPLELATEEEVAHGTAGKVDPRNADKVKLWFKITGSREYGIFFQTVLYRGTWWWRLSGQIYVEADDFRKGAEILKGLCERVRNGEHIQKEA